MVNLEEFQKLTIQRVKRLATGHEEPVLFDAAKAQICTDFREVDAADQIAVGGKAMDPVDIVFAAPAGAGPEVAIHVHADSIGKTG